MMHIIFGLFFIALGIWGVFDEWYYVIDFVKGSFSVALVAVGIFGIFAGIAGSGSSNNGEESSEELERDDESQADD